MDMPGKRFFSLGGGSPEVAGKAIAVNAWPSGSTSYIVKPSSGNRIAIMWVTMSFNGFGANANTTIAFFDDEDDTTDPTGTSRMIIDRISMNGTSRIYPVHLNFSSCPILGEADQVVKGKKQNAGFDTQVILGYYEVP
jgi:hypothetical protein